MWTCDPLVGDDIQKAGNNASEPCCLFTVDKMSLNALKLLDWILRFRHHVELVQDPVFDLSGLFPPAFSPWASFRKEVVSEACTIPDYVMKIRENEEESWRRSSAFDAVKGESGSFYAFHGTSAENLHSILRCGLLNMSNSQLQRNGCMFGEGVYLSTDPGVAYSFCKSGTGWTHSFCGSRVRYMLVCEVAGRHALRTEATTSISGSLKEPASSSSVPNTYVLVKNSDLVKIRYVLVYTEPSRVQITLRSSSFGPPEILPEVSGTHHVVPGRHVPKLGFANALRRVDWCKSFIVLYIALLIGVGLLKHNTGRYGRGSFVQHFFAVYQ
ncbi:hypothetical protein M758_11G162700 [Ceratodon purpureus]|nr:hypothetical protein M758_11G162700 [Ceratodon purpureus]KAG0602137.1 hypothetical protein M758_11G162700 [Ceratodon purpureus]KAG0602140.1 hypothetical protein M758_11G162700 [Ceratodon purpureus]